MSSELAPDGLARVQEFVNSVELPDGPDQLGDPETAAIWLGSQGIEAGTLQERDVSRLRETREALRNLLEAHSGNNVDERVTVRLRELFKSATLLPVVSASGASLAPMRPHGADGYLAAISSDIVEATFKGTWDRLKVCAADTCRWAFYDRSKNARGHWCSMRVCGTRHKAREYRARLKARPESESAAGS
jgi:predicted RNA-binding Zn ribbon-like protein